MFDFELKYLFDGDVVVDKWGGVTYENIDRV